MYHVYYACEKYMSIHFCAIYNNVEAVFKIYSQNCAYSSCWTIPHTGSYIFKTVDHDH